MDITVVQPNDIVYFIVQGQIVRKLQHGKCLDSHFEGSTMYLNDKFQEIIPDALFLEHHDVGKITVEIKK